MSNISKRAPETWGARRIEPSKFPDPPCGSSAPPTTIRNVSHLLSAHSVRCRFNVVKKALEIVIPGVAMTVENADSVAMSYILSLAKLNGISVGLVPEFVAVIADANAYNPVEEWITSRPWDGCDRLPEFYATLQTKPEFREGFKQTLMRKWLLSCAAAALAKGSFKCRGVLTLQGAQGLGKTTWGRRLIDNQLLADSVIKTDHHLDGANKDSLIGAITHFIVEIGELDSSFKRDVARLKGFLTADFDKVRRPYGRADSNYPRRTVFYATVNQADFLVDSTGNTRFWTLPLVKIDYQHKIDMQQLFAQLAVLFEQGKIWWLTQEEESELESYNADHKSYSLVQDILSAYVEFDELGNEDCEAFTPSELLIAAGIVRPTNSQAKECGAILREAFGDPTRSRGRDKWRVPLRQDNEKDEQSSRLEAERIRRKFD